MINYCGDLREQFRDAKKNFVVKHKQHNRLGGVHNARFDETT